MSREGDASQNVVAGYGNFLCDQELAAAVARPRRVGWVSEILRVAQAFGGGSFQPTPRCEAVADSAQENCCKVGKT